MARGLLSVSLVVVTLCAGASARAADPTWFEDGAQKVLQRRCGECHGADRAKRKGELDLRTAAAALKGGESGPAVVPGKLEESRLWTMISSGEMPPDEDDRLTAEELKVVRQWILDGAKSKSRDDSVAAITAEDRDFWSFRKLARPAVPAVKQPELASRPVDRFLLAKLEAQGLSFSPPADRATLIRRLHLDLIGIPPTPEEVQAFVADRSPEAAARLIDRLLESPQYGERWGRHWLDVAGYSDSNGYHRADSPRPLAWRYRDYVVNAFNQDKPYDQFWLEQLAGDELVQRSERTKYSPEVVERLVATHFLRNGPDGTDSTEGNEMARTIERYAVLEQQLQITVSALFGLTIDCARCHSHKFDPIPQTDYYGLQAVFYPAFNVKNWVQPKNRTIQLASDAEIARWNTAMKQSDEQIAELRREMTRWVEAHRPAGKAIFRDDFQQSPPSLSGKWSNTAPGDDAVAGSPGVTLDSPKAPAAQVVDGRLQIIASGGASDGWLVTKEKFDWTPDREGSWIQATFELAADRLPGAPAGAERIGYYIALHDYNGSSGVPGGNILLDGNPAGGAGVHVGYPGPKAMGRGKVGTSGYKPGHVYGVRVSNTGRGQFRVEQIVDWSPEDGAVTLSAADLPDGGFGFEFCCGRSFVVDNVTVEAGEVPVDGSTFTKEWKTRTDGVTKAIHAVDAARPRKPGEIAWVSDLSPEAPVVPLLKRGRYFDPGDPVAASALSVLMEPGESLAVGAASASGEAKPADAKTTGRRLAFARWATQPGSRAAALLARVQVNRIWMGHFGRGLVETPENFGHRGQLPSHPELLEWLAARFVDSGWSMKAVHREILLSAAYQQATQPAPRALELDPENRLLWGYPVHRLESEAVRDSMLAAAGSLETRLGGPPVEYTRTADGQSFVPADYGEGEAAGRRTLYLRHRRSEPITFLQTFDQPPVEPNCLRRSAATVVSQTLAMLNNQLAVTMSERLAARVTTEAGPSRDKQAERAWWIVYCRAPSAAESAEAIKFLETQSARYQDAGDAKSEQAALVDLCQVLLASNEFLYQR